jgi:hypothetical protein
MITSYHKPKTKANTSPLESDEQKKCIEYLEILKLQGNDILYTATAQSTYTGIRQQVKNKALGVRKGLPDLIIIINKKLVFIELKRVRGGVISQEQKQWQTKLKEARQCAYICKGFVEFKLHIDMLVILSKEN